MTRTIKTKGVQTFMGKATNWIFFSKYKSYLSMHANENLSYVSNVVYMFPSFWLLALESRDLSQAEK